MVEGEYQHKGMIIYYLKNTPLFFCEYVGRAPY